MKKVFLFILTLKIFTIYSQNFGDIDLAFPNKTSIVSDGNVECILTQPDGKILIGGKFNRPNNVKSCLIRLNSDGTTDNTFLISSFNVNNGSLFVYSIKLQSDGKIIIGGTFNTINGITKNKIARLNSDGTIDVTFNIGTGFDINSTVNKIGVKSDGKIIVGGNFSSYNGLGQNRLIVLNTDGTKDNNFNIGSGFYFSGWNGNNSARIGAIEIQLDGKIIVGGHFSQYNGLNEKDIIRLNTDGTKDSTFNIGLGFTNPEINKILIQSNGKILIGGKWDAFNNSGYNVIVRLNNDGTRDNTFNIQDNGFFNYVNDIGIESSGKIILAGDLDTFNNSSIPNHLIRLNSDGTRDNTFNLGSSFDDVTNSISILANGKILVGGYFTNFNGYKQNGIIRLNNNGNVDTSFYKIWDKANFTNDFIETTIYDFSIQSDGKILVGGTFSKFNDVEQNGLIRLNIDGTKDATFNIGAGFIAYPQSLFNRTGRIYKILTQPDGKILVCGSFILFNGITMPNSQFDSFNLVRLNSNGSLDNNFNIPNITYPEIALQLDGKIIGISGNSIKRFNTDGTIDNTFIASFTDASKLLVQPDGKILVGKISAGNSIDLIRLNTNGTIDTSFTNGSASSGGVQSLTYLSNGKILVGGKFNGFNTISPVGGLVRLNSNGSLDNTFNANGIAPAGFVRVLSVFVQSDGKLLVGGDDIGGGQFYWRNIIRLNSNGSNDSTNFQNIIQDYYAGTVYKIFQQNDGKILVSGQFNKYGTTESISLIRLNGSYTLEIENFNESKHINIYPNPTTNFITIDCSDNLNAIGGNYKIIDILGQVIQKGNLSYQQNTIDLNNIKGKGIYFVKIFDSLNSLLDNKKIIIQK